MSDQLALFESPPPAPDGLRYAADFASPAVEQELISGLRTLPLQSFQFGEFEGKRRVASFGSRYDYALRQLQRAEPIPAWLAEIVERVETFGGPQLGFGRFSAPNTRSASGSAGTATSHISSIWASAAASSADGVLVRKSAACRSARTASRSARARGSSRAATTACSSNALRQGE